MIFCGFIRGCVGKRKVSKTFLEFCNDVNYKYLSPYRDDVLGY